MENVDHYIYKEETQSFYILLFAFPQFESSEQLTTWLAESGLSHEAPEQLIAFRHTFSHFHLDIIPVKVKIQAFNSAMDEGKGLWYNLHLGATIGLAAPVESLLKQLALLPDIWGKINE